MVAFLFQQQKALCHFSLLVTPISLRIFSILLQKCRQYCLLGIQCKKGWHNTEKANWNKLRGMQHRKVAHRAYRR